QLTTTRDLDSLTIRSSQSGLSAAPRPLAGNGSAGRPPAPRAASRRRLAKPTSPISPLGADGGFGAGGEGENGEGGEAGEGDGEGPEVDREVAPGAIEDQAGEPGAQCGAEIIADAEQAEDEG